MLNFHSIVVKNYVIFYSSAPLDRKMLNVFYQLRIPRIDAGQLFFHIRIGNRIDRVKLI